MATNLALDQELLDRAFLFSEKSTKKAAVTRALQEFIARREQRRGADLFGNFDWIQLSTTSLSDHARHEP